MRSCATIWIAPLLLLGTGVANAGYDSYKAKYAVGVNLPGCSGERTKIISSASDLSALNSAAFDVFCVEAGNYPSVMIKADGTSSKKRVLRHFDGTSIKPWKLAPDKRAVFSGITFTGANHWIVDGISFTNPTKRSDTGIVKVVKNSDNNVFNNVHIYDAPISLIVFNRGSDNNVLQNSVLQDTNSYPGNGGGTPNCIKIQTNIGSDSGSLLGVKNLRIVNNEVFNCTEDGMHVLPKSTTSPNAGVEGLTIENNDFYITNALYTNCSGTRATGGACACAENALDIKVGNLEPNPSGSEYIRILHNRFWGYRKSDRGGAECRSGNSSNGFAVVMHHVGTDNIEISENIVVDTENGFTVARSGPDGISIINNIIHDTANKLKSARKGAIAISGGRKTEMYFNYISQSQRYMFINSSSKFIDVRGNTVFKGGEPRVSTGTAAEREITVAANSYFQTKPISIDKAAQISSATPANNGSFCFKRKRQTKPETYCIPTMSAPSMQQSAAAGQVPGVGIDDKPSYPSTSFWSSVSQQTH